MSKKIEVKTSSKGSLNENDESGNENDKQSKSSGNKKKTGLVASLYNYSKNSGSNSSLNKEETESSKSTRQVVTETELVEKAYKRLPIRMADVLGLNQPTES